MLKSEYQKRMFSALVLLVIFLFAIIYDFLSFAILESVIALAMFIECFKITSHIHGRVKCLVLSTIIILVSALSLIEVRSLPQGKEIILWYFIVIWSTDIFAMTFGKIIGGARLAPSISPLKTWSGLVGGMISASITGLIAAKGLFDTHLIKFIFFGALFAFFAQMSDLLESSFKRLCKVKDSGNLIPGHGGALDRFDSTLLTAPLLYGLIYYGYFL